MKHRAYVIVLLMFMTLTTVISSQEEFDDIYVNEAQTFEVLYNANWEIAEEDDFGVSFLNEVESTLVFFIDPTQFGLDMEGVDDVIEAASVYTEFIDGAGEPKEFTLDDRITARGIIDDKERFDLFIVIEFDDGSFGLVLLAGEEDGLLAAEPIVGTYNNVGSNVGTAKLNLGQSKNYPNQLQAHDETWQDAIAELQAEGIIGSGGSLVFNENYAFFSGQGEWFTPLARNSPHTNIIMAGELTFVAGSTTELERCILSSRITTTSNSATQFLDVGVTNNGNLTVFDFDESSDAPVLEFRQLGADLDETIHILYIAIDDRVTVFVDGQLYIEDAEIPERSGTFGIALIGRGSGARCEGRNIWVYNVPTFGDGVCEVSAGGTVNKRSGPGTNFARAGQLQGGAVEQVMARGNDGSFTWWKLEDESWVREDVVTESGDCLGLPVEE